MVCSAEQTRLNAQKSTGPKSKRGKAIASRNANKHGILSQKPPILATEDLESFQGMVQGLIDEYESESPTEHLLIQQVAMGWLRLHRLWGTEAATANLTILKLQKDAKYPYFHGKDDVLDSLMSFSTGKTYQEVLQAEKEAILFLIIQLNDDLLNGTNGKRQTQHWYEEILEVLSVAFSQCPDELKASKSISSFWLKLTKVRNAFASEDKQGDAQKPIALEQGKLLLHELVKKAQGRLAGIQDTELAMEKHNQAISDAEIASKGLESTELFARYEQHITKQLNAALDRLAKFQEQRNNKGSISSFEQNSSQPNSKI